MSAADEFIAALGYRLPADQRIMLCGFIGDPDVTEFHQWRPRPWKPEIEIPFNARCNVYTTVASFRRSADGSWRRRMEGFAAGRALMIDDIGTKLNAAILDMLPASAVVETSQGNFQAWYFLAEPIIDVWKFDTLIRAFIVKQLLGLDPGMGSVTRVGRLPGFVNGKARHAGWRCELRELNDNRYMIEELVQAFDLELIGTRRPIPKLLPPDVVERNQMFLAAYTWLKNHSMVKRPTPDLSGWVEIVCPWMERHTNQADNGAAVREPNPENFYYGAFRCHHGHCEDKGWNELTEWITERTTDELENRNQKFIEE